MIYRVFKEGFNYVIYDILEAGVQKKVYDKASWHIDNGESKKEVIAKFKAVFIFLNKHNLLTEDGKEILEIGIDGSVVLSSNMVTTKGNKFLSKYYDKVIDYPSTKIEKELEKYYNQ